MNRPIYRVYSAPTPVALEVFEAMAPFLREHFGNPSSSHPYGRRAAEAVAQARAEAADLVGAQSDEIVFTGCATEANNLALRGVARVMRDKGRHIVTSAIEHPSVTAPLERLQSDGWEITELPVDAHGRVSPQQLDAALRGDTVLVSIMHANNEVGTLQPIAELAAIARARGVLFHTDAAQSIGKIPVGVDALGIDRLTIAGHKFYAPKGIGALYVRRGTPLAPVLVGADQEHGLRPGTENVPHIVALGAAARLARDQLPHATGHLRTLCDTLHTQLSQSIPGLQLNGHPEQRLPNTLNISFPVVSGRAVLAATPQIAASVGSACHEEDGMVSGVLAAMGVTAAQARGAVRLSVGRMTTDTEVIQAVKHLARSWQRLRESETG